MLGYAAAALLALGAMSIIPGDDGGDRPPESTLVAVALVVALIMAVAVYAGLRLDLGLPASVALYAVGWNVLVVVVKLYLGPSALYEASEQGRVTSDLGDDDLAVLTAVGVGAAYVLAFWILYRLARGRIGIARSRGRTGRNVAIAAVALVLLFVSGLPVVLLLFLLTGGEYVSFVFTTGASLVAAAALAGATALAALALNSTADRARAVGDATLLATLFWVGVAYLALYHALWVIYILLLTSLWPLKVVSSK